MWIGTPYRHQASLRGVGCDCLGLVRGVWRDVVGAEPEGLPVYGADWGERDGGEALIERAGRYLRAIDIAEAIAGDVLVFRWRPASIAKHMGILTGGSSFIHAWEHAGVVEVPLIAAWRRRIAAALRFPARRD